jgi:hypothetical protein
MMMLGCLIFILVGAALEKGSRLSPIDFRVPFNNTRCLLNNCDPYNEYDVLRIYEIEGGARALEPAFRSAPFLYMPTFFSITAPLALLPFTQAQVIWNGLIYGGLIIASFLTWVLAAEDAARISGLLIGLMLANSEVIALVGNPAGVAISLCVVAVFCFLRGKYVMLGVVCLGIALVIKPHDVGFVWMYFLLAGSAYRKRALQAIAVTAILSFPAVLWTTHVAPHWAQELQATLKTAALHGGANDPGPASSGAHALGMMVNFQTALSFFKDDPHFYNTISYGVGFGLLGLWAFRVFRTIPTRETTWLALAAVSALTMLPIYHRQYDTKLLLLTVPACATLWAEGSKTGKISVIVTCAAFLLNGDIPWAVLLYVLRVIHLPQTDLTRQIVIAVQILPSPFVLLLAGTFYLFVFIRRSGIPHFEVQGS